MEDSDSEHIYHTELWTLTKKMMSEPALRVAFTIPVFEPLPSQYYVKAISDSWLGSESLLAVSFKVWARMLRLVTGYVKVSLSIIVCTSFAP